MWEDKTSFHLKVLHKEIQEWRQVAELPRQIKDKMNTWFQIESSKKFKKISWRIDKVQFII